MSYTREQTRRINLGKVPIGGGAPVAVQSMTNTDTRDVAATLGQIEALAAAGCEVIRCAVPDMAAAEALREITQASPLPVVADIHFDPKLAMASLAAGVAGMRLNPGNIKSRGAVDRLAEEAGKRGAPIRVGANSGSLPKDLLAKYGRSCPAALVEAAMRHVDILAARGFRDVKVSLKSSSVVDTIAAYRLFAEQSDLATHLGVTEAGGPLAGAIKSAMGIGALLMEGIGDTFRVSLTADPVKEIEVAYKILAAAGLRQRGVEIISCPTCGRTEIDLIGLAAKAEEALAGFRAPLTVAVMGCVVNGPGEASHADLGVAGGRGQGVLFVKGKVVKKVPESELLPALLQAARQAEDEYLAAQPGR